MCGIIGYAGHRPAVPVIMEGLARLEYRGYDSAGVGFIQGGKLEVIKAEGKLSLLAEELAKHSTALALTGIGHTRWATHGVPAKRNAHPQFGGKGELAIVHNGIFENYQDIKNGLLLQGYEFESETDTEVLAHLIAENRKTSPNLLEAFAKSLQQVQGNYAVTVLSLDEPGTILAARMSAPLILGVGQGENFVASDIPAFLPYTRDVVFLQDGEIVKITANSWEVLDFNLQPLTKEIKTISWDISAAAKGGYKHFMLKEIFEQPQVIKDCLAGRLKPEMAEVFLPELDNVPLPKRIRIVACGTSYHAGLWGQHLLESWAKLPVVVEIASEFRYRQIVFEPGELVVVVSQSGETADTLAATRLAKEAGATVLAICNVMGSSITREAQATIYTQAGPEISVASTKAMCSQMIIFVLLSMYYANKGKSLTQNQLLEIGRAMQELPPILANNLSSVRNLAQELARKYASAQSFFFLGRGAAYSLALEGALKLKELSYIHAEGYAAGEMKHGPIALIDPDFPSLILALDDKLFPKVKSNIAEIKARRGKVIALLNPAQVQEMRPEVDDVWLVPSLVAPESLANVLGSFLALPAMQLFSYEMADYLGKDVDQPRNLAKSVTVE